MVDQSVDLDVIIEMMDDFSEWVNTEIEMRGWSFSETGRRAGLSPTTISDIISGKTNPGFAFCRGIAQAFGIRPEIILRKAGLLPSQPEHTEEIEELLYYYDQLTPNDQARARALIRTLAEEKIGYDISSQKSASTPRSSETPA